MAKHMATTLFYSIKRVLIIFLFIGVTTGYSQEYGVITPEVRAKMDSNKLNGNPIYTGIVTAYLVQCEGLDSSALTELQNRAQALTVVQGIIIQSNNIIEVVCSGGTGFEQVKAIFSALVTNISSITIENRVQ